MSAHHSSAGQPSFTAQASTAQTFALRPADQPAAQQTLYVSNVGNNTIEEFDSSGVGTQFNVSGTLSNSNFLAFSAPAASKPSPGAVLSLGSLGLSALALRARRRRAA